MLDLNTIYCGDCLEIMKDIPDGSIDAVVTDPPFFTPAVHYQSRVKYARSWGDMSIIETWWSTICSELHRVCPQGHVFVFCNSESYPAFYKAMFPYWEKLKCIVWDKTHVGMGRIFRNQHELIIWARSEGYYYPEDGKLRSDVLRFKATPSAEREHPVEKPVEMLSELIGASTPSGLILDPFLGSGTTAVAALKTGRNFIGIEIDPKYCEIAQRRVDAELAQTKLEL